MLFRSRAGYDDLVAVTFLVYLCPSLVVLAHGAVLTAVAYRPDSNVVRLFAPTRVRPGALLEYLLVL